MRNKKLIIIIGIIIGIFLLSFIISIKTTKEFKVISNATLIEISPEGGDEGYLLSSNSRRVTYKRDNSEFEMYYVETSDFLRQTGILDVSPYEEVVCGLYTEYNHADVFSSILGTIANIFDGNSGSVLVLPFSKQIKHQETIVVPKGNEQFWLNK